MEKEYNFKNGIKNPYAKKIKRQTTLNLSSEVVDYFKNMSLEMGIPYQVLINYYLLDCVRNKKRLNISWK